MKQLSVTKQIICLAGACHSFVASDIRPSVSFKTRTIDQFVVFPPSVWTLITYKTGKFNEAVKSSEADNWPATRVPLYSVDNIRPPANKDTLQRPVYGFPAISERV